MLKVKKLHPDAKLPTRAHEDDLGFDVYSLEDVILRTGCPPVKVKTGIAVWWDDKEYTCSQGTVYTWTGGEYGLIVKDRSSMAVKGVFTHAGVLDPSYRGECIVVMSFSGPPACSVSIKTGDKIAQLIPVKQLVGKIVEVAEVDQTVRADKGFGSTGA